MANKLRNGRLISKQGNVASLTAVTRQLISGRPETVKDVLNLNENKNINEPISKEYHVDVYERCTSLCVHMFVPFLGTFNMIILLLISMQSEVLWMTVRDMLFIVGAHDIISIITIGLCAGYHTYLIRHGHNYQLQIRNEWLRISLWLNMLFSVGAVTIMAWVAHVIPDIDVEAEGFRATGINQYMQRSLDVAFVCMYLLSIPTLFIALIYCHWAYNGVSQLALNASERVMLITGISGLESRCFSLRILYSLTKS